MAIDVEELWDYSKPEESEMRFRQAISGASANDILILQTQIARSFGLRTKFDKARSILASIESDVECATAEVQSRYFLELGRTYASPAHSEEVRDHELETARGHYVAAFQKAEGAGLDYLAIDALHMMPVVDTEPTLQLQWNEKALAYLEKSSQADAKRWEASLRNNVGYARHLMGEYNEALRQFRLSLSAHERAGNVQAVRIAYWMIAWTYRAQHRYTEAIDIQLRLELEWDEAGDPDPYVFEELEHLYRAIDNKEKESRYRDRFEASK